jgi:agmatine deiminase
MKKMLIPVIAFMAFLSACSPEEALTNLSVSDSVKHLRASEILYTMPDEADPHEGTWLQWVHQYEYGASYRNRLDATWIAMTKALVLSEKVHIVAYNNTEKTRITNLLTAANVPLGNIDFKVYPTNDVWVRDNGPIYVRDQSGKLVIEDWGFNGWGEKANFSLCDAIPEKIANDQNLQRVDLNDLMVNEGGAVELDGNGTLLATKSAILNANRNPDMTKSEAEGIFTKYLGATNFIWLDGLAGADLTDMHIDGFAKFANKNTLVTMSVNDLLYWEVPQIDANRLYAAKNKDGMPYSIIKMPLTQNNVKTTYGKSLGYKGSYLNYYIANTVILVPAYNDPNDAVALKIVQNLYPNRKVVGIDVRNLFANGGMIHCVTQQQPK